MADERDESMRPGLRTTNDRLAAPWLAILDNVDALEDIICILGQYVQYELEHSTTFIAMLQDIAGAKADSLVTILRPAVDERLPGIIFNIYNARRHVAHLRQQLQSYPEWVAFQPLSGSVNIDFSLQHDPDACGQNNLEDVHGTDTAASLE